MGENVMPVGRMQSEGCQSPQRERRHGGTGGGVAKHADMRPYEHNQQQHQQHYRHQQEANKSHPPSIKHGLHQRPREYRRGRGGRQASHLLRAAGESGADRLIRELGAQYGLNGVNSIPLATGEPQRRRRTRRRGGELSPGGSSADEGGYSEEEASDADSCWLDVRREGSKGGIGHYTEGKWMHFSNKSRRDEDHHRGAPQPMDGPEEEQQLGGSGPEAFVGGAACSRSSRKTPGVRTKPSSNLALSGVAGSAQAREEKSPGPAAAAAAPVMVSPNTHSGANGVAAAAAGGGGGGEAAPVFAAPRARTSQTGDVSVERRKRGRRGRLEQVVGIYTLEPPAPARALVPRIMTESGGGGRRPQPLHPSVEKRRREGSPERRESAGPASPPPSSSCSGRGRLLRQHQQHEAEARQEGEVDRGEGEWRHHQQQQQQPQQPQQQEWRRGSSERLGSPPSRQGMESAAAVSTPSASALSPSRSAARSSRGGSPERRGVQSPVHSLKRPKHHPQQRQQQKQQQQQQQQQEQHGEAEEKGDQDKIAVSVSYGPAPPSSSEAYDRPSLFRFSSLPDITIDAFRKEHLPAGDQSGSKLASVAFTYQNSLQHRHEAAQVTERKRLHNMRLQAEEQVQRLPVSFLLSHGMSRVAIDKHVRRMCAVLSNHHRTVYRRVVSGRWRRLVLQKRAEQEALERWWNDRARAIQTLDLMCATWMSSGIKKGFVTWRVGLWRQKEREKRKLVFDAAFVLQTRIKAWLTAKRRKRSEETKRRRAMEHKDRQALCSGKIMSLEAARRCAVWQMQALLTKKRLYIAKRKAASLLQLNWRRYRGRTLLHMAILAAKRNRRKELLALREAKWQLILSDVALPLLMALHDHSQEAVEAKIRCRGETERQRYAEYCRLWAIQTNKAAVQIQTQARAYIARQLVQRRRKAMSDLRALGRRLIQQKLLREELCRRIERSRERVIARQNAATRKLQRWLRNCQFRAKVEEKVKATEVRYVEAQKRRHSVLAALMLSKGVVTCLREMSGPVDFAALRGAVDEEKVVQRGMEEAGGDITLVEPEELRLAIIQHEADRDGAARLIQYEFQCSKQRVLLKERCAARLAAKLEANARIIQRAWRSSVWRGLINTKVQTTRQRLWEAEQARRYAAACRLQRNVRHRQWLHVLALRFGVQVIKLREAKHFQMVTAAATVIERWYRRAVRRYNMPIRIIARYQMYWKEQKRREAGFEKAASRLQLWFRDQRARRYLLDRFAWRANFIAVHHKQETEDAAARFLQRAWMKRVGRLVLQGRFAKHAKHIIQERAATQIQRAFRKHSVYRVMKVRFSLRAKAIAEHRFMVAQHLEEILSLQAAKKRRENELKAEHEMTKVRLLMEETARKRKEEECHQQWLKAWKLGWDDNAKTNYYHNHITGERRSQPPEGWELDASERWLKQTSAKGLSFYLDMMTGESHWFPPCSECFKREASRTCLGCDGAHFCDTCWDRVHTPPKKKRKPLRTRKKKPPKKKKVKKKKTRRKRADDEDDDDDDDDDSSDGDDSEDEEAEAAALEEARAQEEEEEGEDGGMASHEWTGADDGKDVLEPGEEYCSDCQFRRAAVVCNTCMDAFCEECNKRVHSSGNRRLHITRPFADAKKGWQTIEARVDGEATYYYHTTTMESTFEKPMELMQPAEKEQYRRFLEHKEAAEEYVEEIEKLQLKLEGALYDKDKLNVELKKARQRMKEVQEEAKSAKPGVAAVEEGPTGIKTIMGMTFKSKELKKEEREADEAYRKGLLLSRKQKKEMGMKVQMKEDKK